MIDKSFLISGSEEMVYRKVFIKLFHAKGE